MSYSYPMRPLKIKVYPGLDRDEPVVFFYNDYRLYQMEDLSMMRRDVVACFECRVSCTTSTMRQCEYKLYIVNNNPDRHNDVSNVVDGAVVKSFIIYWIAGELSQESNPGTWCPRPPNF